MSATDGNVAERRLAINGGDPVTTEPFPRWPSFAEDERAAAAKVLASGHVNYWTGDEGRRFEREYASYLGLKHAIALANGSVALELALRCWDIGPGDEVIVTPRSFVASAGCVVLVGARPVFADVDRNSGNITADSIAHMIGPRTKAVICVHLGGWPCQMDDIMALAEEHDLKVLEDCAQAHGARYRGRPAGSFGDAAVFSFCQDKILTTGGEGGLLATDDSDLWSRAWSFKDHGKSWDAVYQRGHGPGFRWVHETFGTNLRMTEYQAAIGRVQLVKLEAWRGTRARNAATLIKSLRQCPGLRVPEPKEYQAHAWYKLHVYLSERELISDWDRDRVLDAVVAEGVPCFAGSCSEIYLEKSFQDAKLGPHARLEIARELGATSLMFPVHPTLGESHMETMALAVHKVLSVAARTG